MKEIRAYLQSYVLHDLISQLLELPGFPGISVSDCEGIGTEKLSISLRFEPFFPRKRIEMFVPDELVEPIVAILIQQAHTGTPGDGRIFIMDVDESIRISTKERVPYK